MIHRGVTMTNKLVAIVFIIITSSLFAKEVQIKYGSIDGNTTLTIDDKLLDPSILQKYLVIHPILYDYTYLLAPSLDLSIDGDKKYLPATTHDLNDKNFISNAKVNIKIAKDNIKYLENLKEIKELNSYKQYFIDSLKFSLWLNERELAYYENWKIKELEKKYDSYFDLNIIKKITKKINAAKTKEEKYKLVSYEWHNAYNSLYQRKEIQSQIWDDFIKKYRIKEEYISNAF
jgi:hypothetical protein